jgi:hypothetical protein
MRCLKCHAGVLGVSRFYVIGKRVLLWATLSGIVTGSALAASSSYVKNVVKLLQKNPALAPEIVEALKDCRLVEGMTEEQATLVGRRYTQPTPRAGQSGGLAAGIDRIATKDEQGRMAVKLLFYIQNKADLGPSAEGRFQWQKQEGQRVIVLELRFAEGKLAAWGALYDGRGDADRVKIRQDIEAKMGKSGNVK